MILQNMSPILVSVDGEKLEDPRKVTSLWSNLDRAEMDEPCFITRESLGAITKRYDVGPREADIDGKNADLKAEAKAMTRHIDNLNEIIQYMLK